MRLLQIIFTFCILALTYAQSPVGSSGSGDAGGTSDSGAGNDAGSASASSSGSMTTMAATSKVTSAANQATAKTQPNAATDMLTPDWKIVGSLAALYVGGAVLV